MLCRETSRTGAGSTGDVRQLAGARREAFIVPPTRRNRLWQADFSEFETLGQGTWNLGGVVDDWAKVNLAGTVTVTKTTSDAIGFLEAALAHVEVHLGVTGVEDLTDPDTGEIGNLKLVTDNGSCFKSRDSYPSLPTPTRSATSSTTRVSREARQAPIIESA